MPGSRTAGGGPFERAPDATSPPQREWSEASSVRRGMSRGGEGFDHARGAGHGLHAADRGSSRQPPSDGAAAPAFVTATALATSAGGAPMAAARLPEAPELAGGAAERRDLPSVPPEWGAAPGPLAALFPERSPRAAAWGPWPQITGPAEPRSSAGSDAREWRHARLEVSWPAAAPVATVLSGVMDVEDAAFHAFGRSIDCFAGLEFRAGGRWACRMGLEREFLNQVVDPLGTVQFSVGMHLRF